MLIKRKTAKFDPSKFKDQYEAALRELVDAKVRHPPVPQEEPAPRSPKVINLMDALRKSISEGQKPARQEALSESSRPMRELHWLSRPRHRSAANRHNSIHGSTWQVGR